jgi:DNA-binding winged helix-turn-helix (wHTH) protein/TolB-like protein
VIYRFDQFEVNEGEFQLSARGRVLDLEPKALRVLLYLLQNPNRLVRKQELLDAVWKEAFVSESTLTRTISLLRKSLADDQREPRFIETIPTLGYRFKSAVETASSPPQAPQTQIATPAQVHLSIPSRVPYRWPVIAIVSLLIIACATAGFWYHRRTVGMAQTVPAAPQEVPTRSIAVLPFVTRGIKDNAYLGDSIAEEVATSLAQYSSVRVASYTTSRTLSNAQRTIPQIAQLLKLNAVLEGSALRQGDQVVINLRLIDPASELQLWSQQFERNPDNLLGLQELISRQIVQALHLPLSQRDQQHMRATQTANAEAYDCYLRARYLYVNGIGENKNEAAEFGQAKDLLEKATRLDPRYSAAYALMGRIYERRIWWGKGDVQSYREQASILADKALSLDNYSAEAYYVRAETNFSRENGYQWESAARDIKTAIALNPYDPGPHVFLGIVYMRAGLLDKAESENKVACAPDSAADRDCGLQLALIYELQSSYRDSLNAFRNLPPYFGDHVALMLWRLGERNEAWKAFDSLLSKYPQQKQDYDTTSIEAMLLAADGKKTQAEAAIRQTLRNRVSSNVSFFAYAQYRIGAAYALLGERKESLAALEEAAIGLPCYPLYAKDPALASLRGDPPFEAFLARLRSQWQERFTKL